MAAGVYRCDMNSLTVRVLTQTFFGLTVFAAMIFLPAGTWHYWQGWVFIATFTLCTTLYTFYNAIYDRALLARRMNAGPKNEKETSQKIIMSLAGLCFVALIALSALDFRLQLSPVPPYVSIIADAIVALSFLAIFFVTKENSFAAANITVESGQKVIDTGPYAYVRHPMYASAFWMLLAIPLCLGGWYGVLLNIPFMPVLLWRLLDEERVLRRDLPGYTEYTSRVRYRLIPYIW